MIIQAECRLFSSFATIFFEDSGSVRGVVGEDGLFLSFFDACRGGLRMPVVAV